MAYGRFIALHCNTITINVSLARKNIFWNTLHVIVVKQLVANLQWDFSFPYAPEIEMITQANFNDFQSIAIYFKNWQNWRRSLTLDTCCSSECCYPCFLDTAQRWDLKLKIIPGSFWISSLPVLWKTHTCQNDKLYKLVYSIKAGWGINKMAFQ